MPRVMISLLGSPQVQLGNERILITRKKGLALLAYLAVEEGEHRKDRLAALFWPDDNQETARTYLRQTLKYLRDTIGREWIDTDHTEVVCLANTPDLHVDVSLLRKSLAIARVYKRRAEEPFDLSALCNADALYRDEFLAGFSLSDCSQFEEWHLLQRERINREEGEILEIITQLYLTKKEYQTAIGYADRWLSLDPLNELAHRRLIELFVASDQIGMCQ